MSEKCYFCDEPSVFHKIITVILPDGSLGITPAFLCQSHQNPSSDSELEILPIDESEEALKKRQALRRQDAIDLGIDPDLVDKLNALESNPDRHECP